MTAHPIAAALATVRERITQTCEQCGRDPADVTLIAVSKKKPAEAIRAAYDAGQRDFGENYAQELHEKVSALDDLKDIRWHFIGNLQRNKAKFVVPHCDYIHTVDSDALLRKIDTVAAKANKLQHVLLQVNVTGEASKAGMPPGTIDSFVQHFADLKHTSCVGLMTIPELDRDPTQTFERLRQLRDELAQRNLPAVKPNQLSMGMTADLEIAIAQGATMVRVGTAIFGAR